MARLFHALVVMGSSIGISNCAGNADRHAPGGAGGSAGSPTVASGGLQFGSGGAGMGTGGSPLEVGGAPSFAGSEGEAGAPDVSAIAQWTCLNRCDEVVFQGSNYRALIVDAASCNRDPSRPKSAADCGADQWFECKLGVYEGEPVNVDCVCSMIASTGCECLRGETVSCEEPNKLCSCAVTGILVK